MPGVFPMFSSPSCPQADRSLFTQPIWAGSIATSPTRLRSTPPGNAYVTGGTESFNFPTTSNAFQPVRTGLDLDVFVSKLNSTGTNLIYSTFIIGELDDEAFGIAVDAAGAAYVTGVTPGFFFPTTDGALKLGCNFDAFVTKLQPSGSNLAYSTCLGGSDDELGAAIALTQDGSAIITGATESSDFPRTSSQALQGCGRAQDAFVSRLNS